MKNADTSIAMMADKLRHVAETGAEVLTAGDSSCLMHLGGGPDATARGYAGPSTSPRSSPARAGSRRSDGHFTDASERGTLRTDLPFPVMARKALGDTQLRRNLGHATATIRAKRAAVVSRAARLGAAP